MLKSNLLFSITCIILFLSSPSAFGEDKWSTSLLNIDCGHWSTFEEDWAHDIDKFVREKGDVLSNRGYEIEKRNAHTSKLSFIEGLIDAYNTAYAITRNKRFLLPYKVGIYELDINAYCEKPENKGKMISEIILTVNNALKRTAK